jgi:hypothetical protein
MSTTPPPEPPRAPYGYTIGSNISLARMPIPGNAELAVLVFVEIVFTLIWIIADSFDTQGWVTATTALTVAYLISRGIAKASRVLEQ